MCDDLKTETAALQAKGVACSEVVEARWGSITKIRLPTEAGLGYMNPGPRGRKFRDRALSTRMCIVHANTGHPGRTQVHPETASGIGTTAGIKFVFGECGECDYYKTFAAINVMSSGCRCSLR
jgi:hypothetical protein